MDIQVINPTILGIINNPIHITILVGMILLPSLSFIKKYNVFMKNKFFVNNKFKKKIVFILFKIKDKAIKKIKNGCS